MISFSDWQICVEHFDWTRDASAGEDSISARRETQPVVRVKRVVELGATRAVSMGARVGGRGSREGSLERTRKEEEFADTDTAAAAPPIPLVVVSGSDRQPHNEGASASGHGRNTPNQDTM